MHASMGVCVFACLCFCMRACLCLCMRAVWFLRACGLRCCVRVWLHGCVGACAGPHLLSAASPRTTGGAVRAPAASLQEAPSPEAVGQGRLGDLQDLHQDGEEAGSRTVWRSLDG